MKRKIMFAACFFLFAIFAFSAFAITGEEFEVVKCKEYITLREEPSKKADELDRVPLGDHVVMIGYAENDFAYVNYKGQDGYVLTEYLEYIPSGGAGNVELGSVHRYNVNLFLSNFTEQDFTYLSNHVFDIYAMDERQLVEFALDYIWFNQPSMLEWGDWGEYNVRVHRDHLPDIMRKFFGFAAETPQAIYIDYFDPYFYWTETGGHTPSGFACLDECTYLGMNRYRVRYYTFASGEDWSNDQCGLASYQAFTRYARPNSIGRAVIYAPDLNDRTSFRLEWMAEGAV